ncbi:DNA-binding transcription repressor, partial [Coemansia sp. RSA 2618]
MVESPGVVFRFPDKISPGAREVPGLSILPSAAGLPSALGAKSAAAVIAAAAAVSAAASGARALSAEPAPTTAAATAQTSIPAVSDLPALTAAGAEPCPAALAGADLPMIDSARSTPILRPAPAGVSIHRSASNVLHYPELLSDLRDKLIQVHQSGTHASTSSGVESDSSHPAQHPIRRAKPRRAAKTAELDDSSAGAASRRTGLRGLAGSAASTSSPNPGSSTGLRARHEAETESARTFQRRHSIGTIRQQQQQQQDDEDEIVDIDDNASTSSRLAADERQAKSAKRKREKDAGRHSQSPAKRPAPQQSVGGRRCCASCGASSTPCWRPGLIDRMTLCNLCGLRYKKGKVYCAGCSYVPTKTEIATGGASVCKRCTSPIHKQPVSFGLGL